ncbi:hypothetical protein LENED_011657 [Lentinula edodes]|uniref:Uncharacterized protein n=1 Tax=Lentinula edodes TaxID=5353 RepID=A0A1Q3EQL5_LENED|nr:hypothetical protein LENED_011657 [Lentinula edodes]
MALPVVPRWFVINVEPKDTGRVNVLKISEPRLLGAFVVGLQTTTSDTVHVNPSFFLNLLCTMNSSPGSGARPRDHSTHIGSRDYDNGYHGAHTNLYRSRTREDSDRYYVSVDKPQVDSTPNTRFELDGRYYSRVETTTPRNDYDDTNLAPPIPLYTTFSPYAEHVPSWQHEFSYDNKYTQRSISPSYHSPPQHVYEDVDRESAHSRGYTRSKGDSAQGHRSQTNVGRQNSDPDSASVVDRYTGNHREERSTTAHRYCSRSPSPRLQAPRRNAISGDHEYYYSRDFFEASVPQSAYHY